MSAIILIKNNSSLLSPPPCSDGVIGVFLYFCRGILCNWAVASLRAGNPIMTRGPSYLTGTTLITRFEEILESIDRSIDQLGKGDCKCLNVGEGI